MATRAQLNEQAKELGLNPDDYANIDEISAAIRDNQPGLDDEPEDVSPEKKNKEVKQHLKPGIRVERDGKFGEVLDKYGDGFRIRFDDGTEAVVN